MGIQSSPRNIKLAIIPTPRVVISEEEWTRINAHGDLLTGGRSVFVQVHDCPNEFFTNPKLDARVELLRWRKHRHDRSRTIRGESAWRHPDCSVNPIAGARTRGGSQEVPRQSSWLLHSNGYSDYSWIGRITLEDYHYIRQVTVLTGFDSAGNAVEKNINVPVLSGSKQRSNVWTFSQENPDKRVPRYTGKEMNAYYRFRISIRNVDGDGTQGDRLIGPESETIRVSPFPYPVWPTNDGFADGVDSDRLTVAPHQGVAGN